jgi:hypothetical protein
MKVVTVFVLLLLLTGVGLGADNQHIGEAELSLGGVVAGQLEQDVIKRHGAPRERAHTGVGCLLAYPGLDVYVGVKGYGVFYVVSKSASHCTPSGVCPGMPVSVLTRAYGTPVVAEREQGPFLEYIPPGSTCWLQVSAPKGIIRSLRIAC